MRQSLKIRVDNALSFAPITANGIAAKETIRLLLAEVIRLERLVSDAGIQIVALQGYVEKLRR